MVDSFTHTQPKEVSINGYNMINAEFIALKDPVLNHFTSNFSDKEREKFCMKLLISSPLGKIVQVPSAMIDSGANCSVISKGLIKLLGVEVDKNKKPSVKWINNSLESSGISYNISVQLVREKIVVQFLKTFQSWMMIKPEYYWVHLGLIELDGSPLSSVNSS
ncbi:hypothetical protein F8M41_018911 [Gigaspora margarita]|uniref:Uncharacterized protein n=1 Tax=Gigaspora margarita TaxID=4874 RepID=A0A8H4EKZ1_GIGMA|nr:hypothetical protein F8M41_018911 [Gigaspora margarita]